jgi:hypothetical protein
LRLQEVEDFLVDLAVELAVELAEELVQEVVVELAVELAVELEQVQEAERVSIEEWEHYLGGQEHNLHQLKQFWDH